MSDPQIDISRRSLRNIPINLVDHVSYNPEVRREKVEPLKKSIAKVGQLTPIQAVDMGNGRFVTGDGNRTVESLRQLGVPIVQAIVYVPAEGQDPNKVVAMLFEELNSTKRTLKNGEMLQASLAGGPSFNGTVKSADGYLHRTFDNDEIDFLRRQGVTPTSVNIAKKATKWVLTGDKAGPDTKIFQTRFRRTLLWLLKHKTQQDTKLYIKKGYDRDVLRNAIDKDYDHVPRMGKRS